MYTIYVDSQCCSFLEKNKFIFGDFWIKTTNTPSYMKVWGIDWYNTKILIINDGCKWIKFTDIIIIKFYSSGENL